MMKLDADAQALLDAALKAQRPPVESLTPDAARQLMRDIRMALKQPQPAVAEARNVLIPASQGTISARLYRNRLPRVGEAQPLLVFFHGGGWVLFDLDSHDNLCRSLAIAGDCTVLAVDYRLAPEHKFPAAVDDACAAVAWAAENAAALSIDVDRIAVAGDSAGGNLAAVVCQMAARNGAPKLVFQVLIYPAVDLSFNHESYARVGSGFTLTRAGMEWFRDHYLNDRSEIEDWRASPMRAASLAGLPPAYIVTAGCDPLCDEGDAYAKLLAQSGVAVTHRHFPGQMHGFVSMSGFLVPADQVHAEIGAALKSAWAH